MSTPAHENGAYDKYVPDVDTGRCQNKEVPCDCTGRECRKYGLKDACECGDALGCPH
jgi:hypothetical protein